MLHCLEMFNVQSNIAAMSKVTLKEYATKHNPVLSRRGKKMSEGYLYRLIREDIKGINSRDLWFNYVMEGEKDRIFILI